MREIQPPPLARWKGLLAREAAYQFLAGYLKANSHRATENGFGQDARILEATSQIFQSLAGMKPEHVTAESIERLVMRGDFDVRS